MESLLDISQPPVLQPSTSQPPIPQPPLKRIRSSEDNLAQQVSECVKTLSNIITSRDEFSAYGEYIAHKMRNCAKSRREISIAQHNIDEILFRLEMRTYATEVRDFKIENPHVVNTPECTG